MDFDSSKLKMKEESVKGLEVGSKIWAGLDTFIDGSLEFTDFAMSPKQLSLNMVEGVVTKKLKRSFDLIFPAISRKKINIFHSDILLGMKIPSWTRSISPPAL